MKLSLVKLLRESTDEVLYKDEWIQVLKKDGWYTYIHDGTGKFVAVLGYQLSQVSSDSGVTEPEFMILGRFEDVPPHDDGIQLVSLTGKLEENESSEDGAIREFKEESGLDAPQLKNLGTIRLSKSSDSTGYLFAVELVDVDPSKIYKGEGDGTRGEQNSYTKFVTIEQAINSKDPILITMVARLLSQK